MADPKGMKRIGWVIEYPDGGRSTIRSEQDARAWVRQNPHWRVVEVFVREEGNDAE